MKPLTKEDFKSLEYWENQKVYTDLCFKDSVVSAVALLKSEPTSLCLNCNTKWEGIIRVCEKCGAKHTKDYDNQIEHYIDYDDIDECFQVQEEERKK